MKRFLYKISLLLLPLILISYPVDIFISNQLKQSHNLSGEYEVLSDLYGGHANCDIAIYGSSRAWVHINPQILEDSLGVSAYNFGIDGHNFWLSYLRHLDLLKYNDKPKQIIMSVDIFALQKRSNLYQMEQFLPFMLWNGNIRKYTSTYIGYNILDYFIPLKRYFGQKTILKECSAIARNKNPFNEFRTKGYAGMNRTWNSDLEKAQSMQDKFQVHMHQESIELFERFINECKEDNIDLVLVYTPEYIEGQNFIANRNDILDIFKNFAEEYGLLYLDYSDHEMCLNRDYFYNASHLNKEGAELFTRVLAEDLLAHTPEIVYK